MDRRKPPAAGDVTRRDLLERAIGLGAAAALATLSREAAARATAPRRGGTLRCGMAGGSPADSLDPATATDSVGANQNFQVYNCLVEIDERKRAVPELALRWETKPGARDWVFEILPGVEFHNGKTLDAEDVVYSINRHRGRDSTSAAAGLATSIQEVKAVGKNRIVVTLSAGNADLPYVFADFRMGIVPKDFTDWKAPVGTGGYRLKAYEPGVMSLTERNPAYWKKQRAWFDSVEINVIDDAVARLRALESGKVDVINRLDRKAAEHVRKSKKIEIVRSPGGQHYSFAMDCSSAPLKDNNVRLALKHGIDRPALLKTALRGYGKLGNDHPIPDSDAFRAELPQRRYDPDKAKYHLRQAGLSDLSIDLCASEAAFPEAMDCAALYQSTAAKAGIKLNVVHKPADSFWSEVWMKQPFLTSYWGGRLTADLMFSIAYQTGAAWNESRWSNAKFDKLLLEARAELDERMRKEMYAEMQRIVSDEGGAVIPVFADFLDAKVKKLKGLDPDAAFELHGYRLAERGWFEA